MKYNVIKCGDAIKYMKALPFKAVNHVITSPPYNRKRNDKYSFYSDDLVNYYDFLSNIIDESLRVSKEYVFLNVQKTFYQKQDVFKIIGDYSHKLLDIIVWGKSNPTPSSQGAVTNAYEFILVFGHKPFKCNIEYTKNMIITPVHNKMPKIHKAVMRKDVCNWMIKSFTNENDIILDPFMGTGTTAICCLKYNRKYLGIELNNTYVEYANNRIKKFLEIKRK